MENKPWCSVSPKYAAGVIQSLLETGVQLAKLMSRQLTRIFTLFVFARANCVLDNSYRNISPLKMPSKNVARTLRHGTLRDKNVLLCILTIEALQLTC